MIWVRRSRGQVAACHVEQHVVHDDELYLGAFLEGRRPEWIRLEDLQYVGIVQTW